jgi:general secretion pathway protein I
VKWPSIRVAPVSSPHDGFTLLEVLVALVIIGLGMVAVFDQLSQMLTTAARLRDKTFANWIAEDQITELQVNRAYPKVGDRSDEIEMADAEWTYTIKISQVPNMELRRVDVTVSFLDSPDDILSEVAGFVRPPSVGANGNSQGGQGGTESNPQVGDTDSSAGETVFGAGFTPLDPNAIDTSGENQ